jgi:two-component system OmpR family sensor kinase
VALRLRLLLALLVLVVAGLLAADLATYGVLRAFLLERLDTQLQAAATPVARMLTVGTPGMFGAGGDGPVALLPTGTFVELRDAGGAVVASSTFSLEAPSRPPSLPAALPGSGATQTTPDLFTATATGGTPSYRVLAEALASGGTVIVAIPLSDVDATLAQLATIELGAGLVVLLLLGLATWWIVRRGLRPLERMGETAGLIAAGDLGRRVEVDDPRSEVGRLGVALNAMLARLEAAFARQAATEERLRRFLADASHELRTPLTSIRGYAELFRRGADRRPEDLAASMRRIEEEATRMGRIVEDLLLLARLDADRALEQAPVDLSRVAADAVADARAADPARPITLEAPRPVVITGDDARLRQVAANLVGNALAHTPAGTPVRVRAELRDGQGVLEVADQGPGLGPAEAARVFEPFFRADPSRSRASGGAGLGLAIVAAIAAAHGGTASLDTAPGAGAIFRVTIPAARESPRAGEGS